MIQRRIQVRLASVSFAVLVGMILAEVGLRLLAWMSPQPTELVDRFVWHDRPHIRLWTRSAARGPRLLVAGDSFTFGAGIDEHAAYPYRLFTALSRFDAEVLSYSQPGWNTAALHRSLRRDLDLASPDVFILGYCLNDAEPSRSELMLARRPDLQPWRPRTVLSRWLATHSALFSRARGAIDSLRLRPRLRAYYFDLYRSSDDLERWQRALTKISRLMTQREVPAVLVLFPIFDSDLDSDYAYGPLHDLVVETAREAGYFTLDLRPSYASFAGRDLALRPFSDPHPSVLAHDIAGREIARFLEANGLLSSETPTVRKKQRSR